MKCPCSSVDRSKNRSAHYVPLGLGAGRKENDATAGGAKKTVSVVMARGFRHKIKHLRAPYTTRTHSIRFDCAIGSDVAISATSEAISFVESGITGKHLPRGAKKTSESDLQTPNTPNWNIYWGLETGALVHGLFLRGCEGGRHPRRLALKPAQEPPRTEKPANGTRAGRQAMYARAHWRAPLSGFLAFPLDF
jgi:hypothetical protein